MKADFEKGTKVCSKCKRELPIEMFYKNKSNADGMSCHCKECEQIYSRERCPFGRPSKTIRGQSNILKRDYELSEEQLKKREYYRKNNNYNGENKNAHGILIWSDKKLNELDYKTYIKMLRREYNRQKKMCNSWIYWDS